MAGVGIQPLIVCDDLGVPPSGGVERPRRVVGFARLIQRPVRVLGVPSARAASGGNLS